MDFNIIQHHTFRMQKVMCAPLLCITNVYMQAGDRARDLLISLCAVPFSFWVHEICQGCKQALLRIFSMTNTICPDRLQQQQASGAAEWTGSSFRVAVPEFQPQYLDQP